MSWPLDSHITYVKFQLYSKSYVLPRFQSIFIRPWFVVSTHLSDTKVGVVLLPQTIRNSMSSWHNTTISSECFVLMTFFLVHIFPMNRCLQKIWLKKDVKIFFFWLNTFFTMFFYILIHHKVQDNNNNYYGLSKHKDTLFDKLCIGSRIGNKVVIIKNNYIDSFLQNICS